MTYVSTDEQSLLDILADVNREAVGWRDDMSVSIGRARAISGLKETQIRYFEELGALQPAKTGAGSGASRLYSLADLRRLRVLASLLRAGYRPATAAEVVRANAWQIDSGSVLSAERLAALERSRAVDGFLLARVASQLLDAVNAELGGPFALGAALVDRPEGELPTFPNELSRMAEELLRASPDILLALDHRVLLAEQVARDDAPPSIGRDDSTVLLYGCEPWITSSCQAWQFALYLPRQASHMLLLVIAPGADAPAIVTPRSPTRSALLDRLLHVYSSIGRGVLAAPPREHWSGADGMSPAQAREVYERVLAMIRVQLFGPGPESLAVLLVPNSLEQPQSLGILAHSGYDDALVGRVKLDISSEGQGLSGRAYRLREPFFSANASADPRAAFAVEEHAGAALALPLLGGLGGAPFGVLYVASKRPDDAFSGDLAYVALMLASTLGELLGRWWLSRARRAAEAPLHRDIDHLVHWLGGLDEDGPDLQRGIDQLQMLWASARDAVRHADRTRCEAQLALMVFDIDRYAKRALSAGGEPLPLVAQRHVAESICRVLPDADGYWFRNDHTLVVLESGDQAAAVATARSIASQVHTVPLALHDTDGKPMLISVSAAIKVLTYQDLFYLDREGGPALRASLLSIVNQLRRQTSRSQPNTIHICAPDGWVTA